MSAEEIVTLRAAVRVLLGMELAKADYDALTRGLPAHRPTQMGVTQAAQFIARRFVTDQGETEILRRLPGAQDKLRDDYP